MTSMRERTELVGGELTLTRGAAGGLLIRCVIPLKLYDSDSMRCD